ESRSSSPAACARTTCARPSRRCSRSRSTSAAASGRTVRWMRRSCGRLYMRPRHPAAGERVLLKALAHGGPGVQAGGALVAALGEVEQQREVEHDRRGQDRVAAEKVDLHLHRIAEPAEEIDVVPPFLGVAAGGVILDADLVIEIAVKFFVEVGLEDVIEHAEL